MALGDQVGKQAVDELVSQLPQIEAFIDAQLAKIQKTLDDAVTKACGTIQETAGAALKDVTAERTEMVNDINDLITRLGQTKIVVPDRLVFGEPEVKP